MDKPRDGDRRLRPRVWHHDYLLMRKTAHAYVDMIRTQVPRQEKVTVLDYGCGDQPYRPLFAAMPHEYIAADIPENASADVHLDTAGRLPVPDGSVDVVISAQVLEHVPNVSVYLAECLRVLRPRGVLLLSTHGTWVYHPHPADYRRWTRSGLAYDVEEAGFGIAEMHACLGPLAYTTQVRLLLLKGIARALGKSGELLCAPLFAIGQGIMALEDRITPTQVLRDNACVYALAARRA